MKKYILFILLAVVAVVASAQSSITGGRATVTSDQDMQSLVKERDNTQRVFNVIDAMGRHFEFYRFQVNCLATTQDLAGLPDGARITGISLDGNNLGGDSTLTVSFYAQNTALADQEIDGLGFEQNPFPGEEYLVAADVECHLPGDTARRTLFDVDFDPFTYGGDNVLITLDIQLPENDIVNFSFDMATAKAENALVIRTEKYCINSLAALAPILMPDLDFDFNAQQLPAFTMRYFTNDIRGSVSDAQGNLVSGLKLIITDETDNITYKRGLKIEDDGTFAFKSVDPTHLYTVAITGGEYNFAAEHLAFADDMSDIVLNVLIGASELATGDINADGSVDGTDLNILINIILGKDNNDYDGRGNVDGVGGVDGNDLNALINILLGK